eukprot:1301814-Pyramimonas_sp.AAC.1
MDSLGGRGPLPAAAAAAAATTTTTTTTSVQISHVVMFSMWKFFSVSGLWNFSQNGHGPSGEPKRLRKT